jgi:hypothetical protein
MKRRIIENGDRRRAAIVTYGKMDDAKRSIIGDAADDFRIVIKRQNPNIKIGRDDCLEIMAAIGQLMIAKS